MSATPDPQRMGPSGRIARFFLTAQITPLLAVTALLLGLFAVLVTPREEEPQINVTMANVLVAFPGASVADVEQMVAGPAEQVLSQIDGIEHVMSVSRPGMAVLTVQFKVGVARTEALVRLYNTLESNRDWLPANLGVLPPVVKPKGIDDVPIVTLTLFSHDPAVGSASLEAVAHSMERDLKRVSGTREVVTVGGPGRAVNIDVDPGRLRASGVTTADIDAALRGANAGSPLGETVAGNRSVAIEAGPFLQDARAVGQLVVGVHEGRPVYLENVARITDGPPPPERYVWHGGGGAAGADAGHEFPAVVLSVTKKPGQNAVDVADAVVARVQQLRNTVVPAGVQVEVTRNYGETANDKAQKLIHKLLFATASVVALVFLALGRREALIVGSAVVLTLAATLFASWAWGFTLNRVSLFALIFSIGILVDDAIVVVENIHRHLRLTPGRSLVQIIPAAVDEVGGPTILATLTVVAALLPMAFVTGLMGPYMSPIPINASMGMAISLAVAFIITPWLARRWLPADAAAGHHDPLAGRVDRFFTRLFVPFLDAAQGRRNRRRLLLGIAGLIAVSVALPVAGAVVLKMLPFDNKSEFQVVVELPAGSPVERTAALLHEMGAYIATVPEAQSYEAYAGTAAPINFNGLVRQYYLRAAGELGDLQVNLVDKHRRSEQSHAIAVRVRPQLARIGARYGARVAVVEVPPGPPVLAPLVAEVYGPDYAGQIVLARDIEHVFATATEVVDVGSSAPASAPRRLLHIDGRKAALAGVPQQAIVAALASGFGRDAVTYLHDASKYPAGARVQLPVADRGDLDALLRLTVRAASGRLVPLRELVTVEDAQREQPVFHKDLLPVVYVTGDRAGHNDSPLYAMFGMRGALHGLTAPDGGRVEEYFIRPPGDAYRGYAVKWDGEWQVTYETFRDMGAAYAVGLVLIYLLVVAQFGSYLTPLIIMAPIPLTVVGVMPGHALLGAQYTATSMIGMIALAGIIVRNSILLVDFIHVQLAEGVPFAQAIVRSAAVRAQPIALTALAATIGALFILDDPIFNGLAISLIFGIVVSTLLTLLVIPLLYYTAYRGRYESAAASPSPTTQVPGGKPS